jgi:hypothetical protein
VEDQLAWFESAARAVREAAELGVDPVAAIRSALPERLLTAVLPDAIAALMR